MLQSRPHDIVDRTSDLSRTGPHEKSTKLYLQNPVPEADRRTCGYGGGSDMEAVQAENLKRGPYVQDWEVVDME